MQQNLKAVYFKQSEKVELTPPKTNWFNQAKTKTTKTVLEDEILMTENEILPKI
jgi:hypothetical protein